MEPQAQGVWGKKDGTAHAPAKTRSREECKARDAVQARSELKSYNQLEGGGIKGGA